jgi:hypothetical protein
MYIVFLQVKNRLDGREYAVKKVHLSEKDLPNCLKVPTCSDSCIHLS